MAKLQIDQDAFSQVGASNDRACLVVIYGPELGKRASLTQSTFEIGRSSKCELPIDQESISRHHARITFDGQRHESWRHFVDLAYWNVELGD